MTGRCRGSIAKPSNSRIRSVKPYERTFWYQIGSLEEMKHHPMSTEQRAELDQSMGTISEMLEDIVGVLRACYDDHDSRTLRAEEVRAAMQRFRWALERQAFAEAPHNAGDDRIPVACVRAVAADASSSSAIHGVAPGWRISITPQG